MTKQPDARISPYEYRLGRSGYCERRLGTEHARPGDGYYVGLAALIGAGDEHRGERREQRAGREKDVGGFFILYFHLQITKSTCGLYYIGRQ